MYCVKIKYNSSLVNEPSVQKESMAREAREEVEDMTVRHFGSTQLFSYACTAVAPA